MTSLICAFSCPINCACRIESERRSAQGRWTHIPKILKESQEAGKIVAGDPDRLALTIGAALQGLVAMSIDGKIKGAPLKAIVSETVQHVLKGLSTNKN